MKASLKQIFAFKKLNSELRKLADESGSIFASVEDEEGNIFKVRNLRLHTDGRLTWVEKGRKWNVPAEMSCTHEDALDIENSLYFWRGCLRRAQVNWTMDTVHQAMKEGRA